MKSFKKIIWQILNWLHLAGPLQLVFVSQLRKNGWFNSFRAKQAIDQDGNPLPWCTYSFIKFIEPKLNKSLNVFEYGSGNSTLWYAPRVNSIKSVEHDKDWFDFIAGQVPNNSTVVYKSLEKLNEYSEECLAANSKYDIIIIDGRERNACAQIAMHGLTDNGIIIFDNANLADYNEGVEFILTKGFKKLDFWGISPVTVHETCTTIFYRANNCLDI